MIFTGESAAMVQDGAQAAMLEAEAYLNMAIGIGAFIGTYCVDPDINDPRLVTIVDDNEVSLDLRPLYTIRTIAHADQQSAAEAETSESPNTAIVDSQVSRMRLLVNVDDSTRRIAAQVANWNDIPLRRLVFIGAKLYPWLHISVIAGGEARIDAIDNKIVITKKIAHILKVADINGYF